MSVDPRHCSVLLGVAKLPRMSWALFCFAPSMSSPDDDQWGQDAHASEQQHDDPRGLVEGSLSGRRREAPMVTMQATRRERGQGGEEAEQRTDSEASHRSFYSEQRVIENPHVCSQPEQARRGRSAPRCRVRYARAARCARGHARGMGCRLAILPVCPIATTTNSRPIRLRTSRAATSRARLTTPRFGPATRIASRFCARTSGSPSGSRGSGGMRATATTCSSTTPDRTSRCCSRS